MAEILDTLRRQHAHMRAILQVIENAVEDFGRGGRLDPYLADAALRYVAEFPKTVHRPAEAAIYKALVQANAPVTPSAEAIAAEHLNLEARAERLRTVLFWSGQHPQLPRELAASMARALIDDMRRHMSEEENTLFPAAERSLDAAAWSRVKAVTEAKGYTAESRTLPLRELLGQIAALTPPAPRPGKDVKPA